MRVEYEWGSMEWFVDAGLTPTIPASAARMIVHEGASGDEHRHSNCDEVIRLEAGELTVTVDGVDFVLLPGDTVMIPERAWHRVENTGEGEAVAYIVYGAAVRAIEFR